MIQNHTPYVNTRRRNSPGRAGQPIIGVLQEIFKRLDFIVLGNETFQFRWLKIKGFYRILWFGFIAKFGVITYNQEAIQGIHISYGSASPLKELLDKGYTHVTQVGKIFGEPILRYSNHTTH